MANNDCRATGYATRFEREADILGDRDRAVGVDDNDGLACHACLARARFDAFYASTTARSETACRFHRTVPTSARLSRRLVTSTRILAQ